MDKKRQVLPENKYGGTLKDSDGNVMTFTRFFREYVTNEIKETSDKLYHVLNILSIFLVYPLYNLSEYFHGFVEKDDSILNPMYWVFMVVGLACIICFFSAVIGILLYTFAIVYAFIKLTWIYMHVKIITLIVLGISEAYLLDRVILHQEKLISTTFDWIILILVGLLFLGAIINLIMEIYENLRHKKNYLLTLKVEELLNKENVSEAIQTLNEFTMKNSRNKSLETIIDYYLNKKDFKNASGFSEKMKHGSEKIVRAYIKEGMISEAIAFAKNNNNSGIDYVIDFYTKNKLFSEAIELTLQKRWGVISCLKEIAKESALSGEHKITKKVIQIIFKRDNYKYKSYGDCDILHEVAILLEEKKLFHDEAKNYLMMARDHINSIEDKYDKKSFIEKIVEDIDDSDMPEESKIAFKTILR